MVENGRKTLSKWLVSVNMQLLMVCRLAKRYSEDNCQDIWQGVGIMTWPAQVMTPATLLDDT